MLFLVLHLNIPQFHNHGQWILWHLAAALDRREEKSFYNSMEKKQKQKKLKSFPFTGFIVTKPDTAFYSPYSSHLLKTLYIPVYWYCLVLSWLKLARKRLPFFFKSFILNIMCLAEPCTFLFPLQTAFAVLQVESVHQRQPA